MYLGTNTVRTETSARPLGAIMLRFATWLAASTLPACFVCIAACGWLDQLVYVDEAGLLAGFSAPTFSAANVSRLPRWPSANPVAQQQWLVDRLDERDLLPEVHALRHSEGCSCAAVSAVVHAGRGDGREAVLLSTAAMWNPGGSGLGQLALRGLLSAPNRVSGCPKRRPSLGQSAAYSAIWPHVPPAAVFSAQALGSAAARRWRARR